MHTQTMCRHAQDRHQCIFTQNAQLFPPRHRHSKTARWTKMMLLLTSRRMMNIVHAHVNIEEDAPASEQATSDYHRLLREAPDLAAIVVFHPVSQRRQLAQPPST